MGSHLNEDGTIDWKTPMLEDVSRLYIFWMVANGWCSMQSLIWYSWKCFWLSKVNYCGPICPADGCKAWDWFGIRGGCDERQSIYAFVAKSRHLGLKRACVLVRRILKALPTIEHTGWCWRPWLEIVGRSEYWRKGPSEYLARDCCNGIIIDARWYRMNINWLEELAEHFVGSYYQFVKVNDCNYSTHFTPTTTCD